jgi:hypothetical protein
MSFSLTSHLRDAAPPHRAVAAKAIRMLAILAALSAAAGLASATPISLIGTLSSPEDTYTTTVTLANPGTVTLQTWSFGGGTNAANTLIPAGGFDPLIAIFAGTGAGATLETSGPITYGTSDALSNYASFTGCPPAGTVTIGSFTGNCGDITMSLALGAGTYTVLLSDAGYIPNAVFDNGTLGEGFTDLTGGAFQTCVNADNCITGTANWAFDITTSGASSVPEPSTFCPAGLGLLVLAGFRRWILSRESLNQMKRRN